MLKINLQNFFSKKNAFKLTLLFLLAGLISVFFWQYLNSYLKRSKADASSVTFSLIPATLSFNNQEIKEIQLIAQFQNGSASEKIDYLKVKINFPKDNLELADYVDTTASSLGRQIRVDGPVAANGSGVIVIELGASSLGSGPATNSGPVTIAKIKFKGKSAIQNGAITIDNNVEIYNNLAAAITQITKNNATFSVTKTGTGGSPTPTCSPLPAGCLQLYPTICPTQAPTGGWCAPSGNVTLNLKLKFQGILKKPSTSTMKVKIGLKYKNDDPIDSKTVDFTSDGSGLWSGTASFSNIDLNRQFKVLVKGPKHLQKRVCAVQPTETAPGTYRCTGGTSLTSGANSLDFSAILQLVGDLPEQDGVVNSYDTSLVRNNLGKTDAEALRLTDLNLDGVVDTQDYSLVIAALSVRADEE